MADQRFTNVDRELDTGVTVTTAWTTVGEFKSIDSVNALSLELQNAGSVALSDTRIQIKAHPRATYESLLTGAVYGTLSAILLFSGGDKNMNTLPASATELVQVRLSGAYAFRVQCKVGSGTTVIKLYARICGG